MKVGGERQRDEEGEAEGNEDEHLPSHFRNGSEVWRPQVQEGVDGEDHQRHGQDHVGDAGIPTSDLADGDDDEPGDHTVHDEFDHARRR